MLTRSPLITRSVVENAFVSKRLIHTVTKSSQVKFTQKSVSPTRAAGPCATQTPFPRHLNPINSCRRIVTVGFNVPKLIKPGPTVQGRFHSNVPACSRKFGKHAIECSFEARKQPDTHAQVSLGPSVGTHARDGQCSARHARPSVPIGPSVGTHARDGQCSAIPGCMGPHPGQSVTGPVEPSVFVE
jgi:hypothetical protein